ITVTITGVNDAAVITGVDTGAVIEDAANPTLSDSGKLEITDVDGTDEAKFDISSVAPATDALGSITIDELGNWDYSVANDKVQYLGEGETKSEQFTVKSLDGTDHTITVTITGVNDAAEITGIDTGAVIEDAANPMLSDSGKLEITDVDGADEAKFDISSVTPAADALGSITIDESGNWDYSVDNTKVQYLGEGETKSEQFTVESLDGTEHTITVIITGVNDAAEIIGVDTGAVIEDAANPILSDSGKLEVTDVDGADEAKFDTTSVVASAGALGSLILDESGNWDYSVDNAKVQYLGEGETKSEVFTVKSLDGTDHTITVTITGVNDAAEITGIDTGAVIEDAANPMLSDSGKLEITDVDGADEAKFDISSVTPAADALGSITIDESGNWDYSVDNTKVQYLGEGETKSEQFTVESLDGTEHTITVTITGVNDAAEISGDALGSVVEDTNSPMLSDNGSLRVSDTDGSDEASFKTNSVVAATGTLGALTLTEAGDWSYSVANAAVQYLGEGETKSEEFTVESLDGTDHTITVTITGVNDAAEITGIDTGAVIEDAANPMLTDSGKLEITDVDGADEAKFDISSVTPSAGALGSITIDESGNWDYSVDNAAVQYLGEGETKSELFTVESLDGTEHTITVTITGVNDAAVITGVDTGAVIEDAANPILSDFGKLEITDVDGVDEAKFDTNSVTVSTGVLGSLTINESGNWDYSVANEKVQYLGEGETKSELFTVESLDGTEHTITVTITGVNDAAVITGVDTGAVIEDAANPTLSDSGKLEITDVDGTDEAKFDISSVAPATDALGSITIDELGNWDYSVANDKVQ
ncbi:VCBS domain-containing protein, partial [Vibrio clamense]|uniref:VCBS domain-containing protein n=1 Tax=Vibrio clamense TaxID=2910254 RepID=UPI003D1E2DCD